MSDLILSVTDDYVVEWKGQRLGLASPPSMVLRQEWDPFSSHRATISFDVFELPPIRLVTGDEPKPKRKWSTAMGLRKPK